MGLVLCSSRPASSKFDFLKDEYNKWTAEKKSIWFTTLVEPVAYFLLWQIKSGKEGIRFISLGENACHFWDKIVNTALVRVKATLSANGVVSSYFAEFLYSHHPSVHHKFLPRTGRQQLDQALNSAYAELLEQFGRRNELGEPVRISLFEDLCSESDDIDEELLRLMKRDALMRTGGKEGSAVYELGREQTDEEIREDRRYLKRGTQIRFLGNVWVNKQTKPLSEISDEEIDELHRRKCMMDAAYAAGGEDEILAATGLTDIDAVPIDLMRPMAEQKGRIDKAGGKKDILAAFRCTNINDISIEVLVLLCTVGGVNPMKELLGVDSLVGVANSLLEEQTTFWTNLKDLEVYKEENGNVCVPQNNAKNKKLAKWVNNVRQLKQSKSSRLTKRREELLNKIGFVWNTLDAAWEEMFNQLVKYKADHGDTIVPSTAGTLGKWVSNQRVRLGKKRKMPQNNSEKINQRIYKLNNLGFKW